MEAVSAKEQENLKRKTRSGSVPNRATTPTASSSSAQATGGYVPGQGKRSTSRTGAVTPAVRPRSAIGSTAKSAPNKRQKLGDSTSSIPTASSSNSNSTSHPHANMNTNLRVPLSSHRNNHRPGSPTRVPAKTPGQGSAMRTRAASATVASGSRSAVTGSQQRRYPSVPGTASRQPYTSATVTRAAGSVGVAPSKVPAKSMRAHRESFKPRPSIDHLEMKRGVNGAPAQWASAVDEEEED